MTTIKPCCDALTDAIDDEVIQVLDNIPFRKEIDPEGPTIYFCNDGGHHGMYHLKYCPFCGIEFELLQNGEM